MKDAINDFFQIAKIAGIEFRENQIKISDLGCPHIPNGLSKGMMGFKPKYEGFETQK